MSPKTVLITGGAGFIGSHLVDTLIIRGDRVVVLDNFNDYYSPAIKRNNLKNAITKANFSLIEGDILDNNLLNTVFSKYHFDSVIHLAARAGVRPSLKNPKLYFDVNVTGTLAVLDAARMNRVSQFIFGSSSSVYGNRQAGPFKETETTETQISPYGVSKKLGEILCASYAHEYGINTTCLRFFTAYGPRNRPDMAMFLFMDALMHNKPITIFGDGKTGRDYTFINDLVSGIVAAIEKPQPFEILNLGNSHPVVITDLIATMEKITGKKARVGYKPMQRGDVTLTYADITKAKKILGWKPTTDLNTGLGHLYTWYQSSTDAFID